MANATPDDLGLYIFNANPYVTLPAGNTNPPAPAPRKQKALEVMLEDDVEHDYASTYWTFKGTSHYIKKAIRIPYCFTDKDGQKVRDYILVGFEGGGGV